MSTSAAQRQASDVAAMASRPGITRRATIVAMAISTLPASERPTPRKSAVANACHQGAAARRSVRADHDKAHAGQAR